jgi:hypothetical protein
LGCASIRIGTAFGKKGRCTPSAHRPPFQLKPEVRGFHSGHPWATLAAISRTIWSLLLPGQLTNCASEKKYQTGSQNWVEIGKKTALLLNTRGETLNNDGASLRYHRITWASDAGNAITPTS